MWFDAQDLSNIINVPSTNTLRLENKAGTGYALGASGGGGTYPTLVGVTPLNNKRAIYFNNTVANANEQHLHFVDTKAMRTGGAGFTVFFVGRILDDDASGVNYDYGLMSLKGQNNLGTVEECNWLSALEAGPITGVAPEYEAYSKTDIAASASSGAITTGAAFDPFYMAARYATGANTDFYYNGVLQAGNAIIVPRSLDGDGFVGAALSADCVTPTDFGYMYFGELLVYDSELTADQITSVNSWLASKWGF